MNHNMHCCVPIKITFQTQTIRFDQIFFAGPQQINHNFATGAGGRGAACGGKCICFSTSIKHLVVTREYNAIK